MDCFRFQTVFFVQVAAAQEPDRDRESQRESEIARETKRKEKKRKEEVG